ncbi:hypothetical protein Neosp_009434 [[Neocosmospora] mangrovei]
MATIKNVAVIGATGNLGPHITRALVDHGFKVTALTRASSSSALPVDVEVKRVDFESQESIIEALRGQDAVISTIGTLALPAQLMLIDAAVSANVKRFIPSEFGVDTRLVTGTNVEPLLAGKIKVVEYLKEKAQQHGLLRGAFGFDVARRHVTIFDSGNALFSPSSYNLVGKAVAAILSKEEETKNHYLAISSFTTSQNQLLKMLEEQTGEEWAQGHVSTSALEKIGLEKLGQKNPLGVLDLM